MLQNALMTVKTVKTHKFFEDWSWQLTRCRNTPMHNSCHSYRVLIFANVQDAFNFREPLLTVNKTFGWARDPVALFSRLHSMDNGKIVALANACLCIEA